MRAPRLALPLLAALSAVLAGCGADAQDPFAYTRKPLYTGHFELEPLADGDVDSQEFRVEDGSIAGIRVQVWINATAGNAKVDVIDPSGRTVVSTTQHAEQTFPLTLGVWKVIVTGQPGADGKLGGNVGILATRK